MVGGIVKNNDEEFMKLNLEKQSMLTQNRLFEARVLQTIISSAITISNEAKDTPNHRSRAGLANATITNPDLVRKSFLTAVVTQLEKTEPLDEEINNAVAAIWDAIALAMFPAEI